MNFFEKLKLKTTLRNCDYTLAGKVIRQQFYVEGRDAEINHLIEEYDQNPSFEAAVKLIDHNELLLFYFTESCSGGLYIRQHETDHNTTAELTLDDTSTTTANPFEETLRLDQDDTSANRFSINPQKMAAKVDPDKIQHLEESYNWMKEMIAKQSPKSTGLTTEVEEGNLELEFDLSVDQPISESEPAKPSNATKRHTVPKEIQQINLAIDHEDVDSETATLIINTEEIQLVTKSPKKQKTPKEEVVEVQPVVAQPIEEAVQEETVPDFVLEEPAIEEELIVAKPKREIEVFYETAPLESLPDWVNEVDEDELIASALGKKGRPEPVQLAPTEPATPLQSDLIGAKAPNMDTAPLKSILEGVRAEIEPTRERPPLTFANIISTVQLDIDTMRKQLNDYKRELRINPWDSDQLQAIIYSLEDAIYEFNEAIRILNENKTE